MLPKVKRPKHDIYLDYAATTPLDLRVKKSMEPFWVAEYGNPSSLYRQGRQAKAAVDSARSAVADIIGARTEEIIFTAGGTESVNLAIMGVGEAAMGNAKRVHIISTAVEHHAVLHALDALHDRGALVTLVGTDAQGRVLLSELKRAVRPETVLVSVMYANNEIGTVQPVAEVGKWLRSLNAERQKNGLPRILLHTDACQAAGMLDLGVSRLGVDLLSANGSKIYGPKQVGFLFVKNGTNLKPVIYGGGQERNLRSGTENVPGIVGLAKALKLAQNSRTQENKKLLTLQRSLVSKLKKVKGVALNGPEPGLVHGEFWRLPNNINITVDGVEGESLMLYLDSYGVAVSTGSACTTGMADPSHVLLAIGRTPKEAKSSIRITLGRQTTKAQLNYVYKVLSLLILELRKVVNF